jgi:hypothetical protein
MWFLLVRNPEDDSDDKPDQHKEILPIEEAYQSDNQETDCKDLIGG